MRDLLINQKFAMGRDAFKQDTVPACVQSKEKKTKFIKLSPLVCVGSLCRLEACAIFGGEFIMLHKCACV